VSYDDKPFVRLGTLAYRLGLSQAAVRRWALNGEIPFVMAGKSMMFNTEEVIRTLNTNAQAKSVVLTGLASALSVLEHYGHPDDDGECSCVQDGHLCWSCAETDVRAAIKALGPALPTPGGAA
jgi:excisionase family DNA binding protein